MTPFEQALWDRLKKLDEDYQRHRTALLTTISLETGRPIETLEHSDRLASNLANTDAGVRPGDLLSPSELRNQLSLVEAAVEEQAGEFTKDHIKETLEKKWPGMATENTMKNLASFLWRLHTEGTIVVKEKGQGHRQSVYMLASTKKEPTLAGEAPK